MKTLPLKTLLVGFGRIAALYSEDPLYSKRVKYATHAQVLSAHKAFDWIAVVDTSKKACKLAERRWGIKHTATKISDLDCANEIEVAVIATPPEVRCQILNALPALRAVMVEKPIAPTVKESKDFLEICKKRNIVVQVNITRRADPVLRKLAAGRLFKEIGPLQMAFGIYGNGLINAGTHLVDQIRFLLGEVKSVQAAKGVMSFNESPIRNDINIPFSLRLNNGATCMIQPVRFKHYRELGLDIWGKAGRISVVREGLNIIKYPLAKYKSFQGANEIDSSKGRVISTGYGEALYQMYDNLVKKLSSGAKLFSPGDSALKTAKVVESIFDSYKKSGKLVLL
jgi:myo-inositol 2-dehydrogenase/D-chiro-inositol 1-dehydrogenase/scyllo-inositol 2-dehydrogenase (NAD+)